MTYGKLVDGTVVEVLGLAPSQQRAQAGDEETPFMGMMEGIVEKEGDGPERVGDKMMLFPEDLVSTWEE